MNRGNVDFYVLGNELMIQRIGMLGELYDETCVTHLRIIYERISFQIAVYYFESYRTYGWMNRRMMVRWMDGWIHG